MGNYQAVTVIRCVAILKKVGSVKAVAPCEPANLSQDGDSKVREKCMLVNDVS